MSLKGLIEFRSWAEDNATAVRAVILIVGFGYGESQLEEKRPPNRDELDVVSTDVPIIIVHQSGHFGVANSKPYSWLSNQYVQKKSPSSCQGVCQ